jgi:hypothetical protein
MKTTRSKARSSIRATRSSFTSLAPPLIWGNKNRKRTHTLSQSQQVPTPKAISDDDDEDEEGEQDDEDEEDYEGGEDEDEPGSAEEEEGGDYTRTNKRIFDELDKNDQFPQSSFSSVPTAEEDPAGTSSAGSRSPELQNEIPVPDSITICVNFRRGQKPTQDSDTNLRRIKNWPPQSFTYRNGDGFNLLHGRIADFIDGIRAKKEYRGVQWWDTETPYIKSTHSARQAKYVALTPGDFQQLIKNAWRSEYKNSKKDPTTPVAVQVFAYLKDTAFGNEGKTIQRQSRARIEEANRLLSEARTSGGQDYGGRVTQTIYSRDIASRVGEMDDLPPPPPNNPVYRQARQLDARIAEVQQQRATTERNRDVVTVKVLYPGDHWVPIQIDIAEVRTSLGFDLTRIGETTRDPSPPPIARPSVDIVDTDH